LENFDADTAILQAADDFSGCVLTFDKPLRDRCKAANVPVITNFRKGKLHLIGYVD